eukprot:m.246894 g.246894  ORF g.246894 m.246894 type:complete len:97 (+) comp54475_c1_seq6:19-309(+)
MVRSLKLIVQAASMSAIPPPALLPWQNGTDAWAPGHFVGTDRQFALGAGIGFATPETAFLGAPAPTADQIHQAVFDNDWCDKNGPTPWCKTSRAFV